MKIGIISDIHAQFDALKRVLRLLEKQAVDQIICVGDLIDRGDDGDAVVALINRREIPCVQGNHDKMAKSTQAFIKRNPHLNLPLDALKSETVEFLSALPQSLKLNLAGVSVMIVHDNPWHDQTQYIFPNSGVHVFQDVVKTAKTQIIIMGHTHLPMCVHYQNSVIVNPGSVCINRVEYNQTCGILHLPERKFDLYDINSGNQLTLKPIMVPTE